MPRPSPPVNQHPNPPSGPVSLPDWANLPGLTLPPDLSMILGTDNGSVLRAPTFADAEQRELPTLPVFEPPYIPERPDVQEIGKPAHTSTSEPPAPPRPPSPPTAPSADPTPSSSRSQPATTPYAPPPVGAQYDVPPPPGMAHVPSTGIVLPPSAFVAPQPLSAGVTPLPPVGSTPPAAEPSAPIEPAPLPRTVPAQPDSSVSESTSTLTLWLIAALPLLQFAVIYVVFKTLNVELAPSIQWGILVAPAAFSLLFALSDRRKLTERGYAAPNALFGLIPPLYLAVRCATTGRSAVPALVAWVVLQLAAAAGVYFLLPSLLAAAIHSFG